MKMVQVILLGMGVQSTALYYMSSLGILPRADYAIFSDLGRESEATYRYLDFLLRWKDSNNGIPIEICRSRNLYEDLLTVSKTGRFTSIPAFVKNTSGSVGMLRRQCTSEYKIAVIDNYIRDHIYRLPKGSRRPKTAMWLGITLDEIRRMSVPYEAWKVNTYPFLGVTTQKQVDTERLAWGIPMTREELISWYGAQSIPVPPKSSCVFCPYQSDHSWAMKKKYAPEDFKAAVLVDEAIRNSTAKGINNPVFLHRTCKPLQAVDFNISEDEEWGECSANCHT